MNGEQRRTAILLKLNVSTAPLSASSLANDFSVTRQIIVADIALLRAQGHPIVAVHKGYILDVPQNDHLTKCVVVKHGKDMVAKELYAIVDNGGKVLDVEVEHSIYGLISAELNIASRYDADDFVERISVESTAQLSDLTGGVHIHTLSANDEAALERIVNKLSELGILVSND